MEDSSSVLFDDDEITVIKREGASPYALVTFGDLTSTPYETDFYAKIPASKLDISCLGFMAKRANWYPQESVASAVRRCQRFLCRFDEVITLGCSMGGYAAIRYSRILGSQTTLAMAPQWSIDPADYSERVRGWNNYFDPSTMIDMRIKDSEVSGQIYIFFDACDRTDNYHARKIQKLSPRIDLIPVPGVGHDVARVLSGTETLATLLSACRERDRSALLALTRNSRKQHDARKRNAVTAAVSRHPTWAQQLLERDGSEAAMHIGADLLPLALETLENRGDKDAAIGFLDAFRPYLMEDRDQIAATIKLDHLTGTASSIMTAWSTELLWHPERGLHHASTRTICDVPVRIRMEGDSCSFFAGAGLFEVKCDHSCLEVRRADRGKFSFALQTGRYLTALPDGTIAADRQTASSWEMFAFGTFRK